MKSPLNAKISLAIMTSFLLVGAPLLGFSFVVPIAGASLPVDDAIITIPDNGDGTTATESDIINTNAINAMNATVELSEDPFAVGNYSVIDGYVMNETHMQIALGGYTILRVPDSNETITTIDTGEVSITFLAAGAVSTHGQLYMTTQDGSENATAEFVEFSRQDRPLGIGIAYFSTDTTGVLTHLNDTIAVFTDESQSTDDFILSFFEWKDDEEATTTTLDNNNSTRRNETTTANT
jgi:hypothetical protein